MILTNYFLIFAEHKDILNNVWNWYNDIYYKNIKYKNTMEDKGYWFPTLLN